MIKPFRSKCLIVDLGDIKRVSGLSSDDKVTRIVYVDGSTEEVHSSSKEERDILIDKLWERLKTR